MELHCLHGLGETEEKDNVPTFCKYGVHKPGYHCLANDCQFAGHAPAPHEIAYSHEDGEVGHDAWIGFGGDMEPEPYNENAVTMLKDTWKKVCKEKVHDAYDEYMLKSKLNDK
ncbi:hypothetical protein [Bacillus sp. FJAT-28004]|uniref:hypothetical protein n=1 Tax=Bacillus sp. FJAT-28004 TaxID=1679165 RepID=UPI0006B49E33|nr:hypothetical protein [Bacillus sp. FJAT-28004]